MNQNILRETTFKDLKLYKRGKVRDVYDLGDKLLIVATDRISCFDVVLPSAIPDKGKILTELSCFWFEFIKDIVATHFISRDMSMSSPPILQYEQIIKNRAMLVLKTRPLPIECVVRGYLCGSAWREYKENNSVCGMRLPRGLKESEKLPQSVFTPATKEDSGHDINVNQQYIEKKVGKEIAARLKDISLAVYKKASNYAEERGIIIADTKFEFGIHNGQIMLIDEVLTPDSSRFWPKEKYIIGKSQESFDKQFVRDYLESLNWNKTPPAPELPIEVIEKTRQKYLEALKRITGLKV
jgi:phosphoribosylaminoimidazole-succinocarboxamide synthase